MLMYYLHSTESIFCVVGGDGGLVLIINLCLTILFILALALQKVPLLPKKSNVTYCLAFCAQRPKPAALHEAQQPNIKFL